jgi:hypothetical protein
MNITDFMFLLSATCFISLPLDITWFHFNDVDMKWDALECWK